MTENVLSEDTGEGIFLSNQSLDSGAQVHPKWCREVIPLSNTMCSPRGWAGSGTIYTWSWDFLTRKCSFKLLWGYVTSALLPLDLTTSPPWVALPTFGAGLVSYGPPLKGEVVATFTFAASSLLSGLSPLGTWSQVLWAWSKAHLNQWETFYWLQWACRQCTFWAALGSWTVTM